MVSPRPFQGNTSVYFWPFGLHLRPVLLGLHHLRSQAVRVEALSSSLSVSGFDGVVRFLKRPTLVLLKLEHISKESVLLLFDYGFECYGPERCKYLIPCFFSII